jgi:hypothetical protein
VAEVTADSIRSAREAAGWSVVDAARELKRRSGTGLPELDSLVRSWKRWERGTSPGRFYRPLLFDLLGLGQGVPAAMRLPMAEVPQVFRNQTAAGGEIRSLAVQARRIDVLAVRGLGLLALNDSLLRPALQRTTRKDPLRLRVLLLRSDSAAVHRRAAEIRESPEVFLAGLTLAEAKLHEVASMPRISLEVYGYDALPVWRLIGIDDTLYVSTFAEAWEGHESAVYKVVPTPLGPLHRGFQRMFEDLCDHATRII